MRNIDDVLLFRGDLPPFLVHLTRRSEDGTADQNLTSILESQTLHYGPAPISVARYRYPQAQLDSTKRVRYFTAVSFTETPLNEIHSLLEIEGRIINLEPYGLVFLRDRCKAKGVAPVIYFNNVKGDKDEVVQALCTLLDSHPRQAASILPFVSFFGRLLTPLGGSSRTDEMDFTWEREWRYVSKRKHFKFKKSDVFVGLCPHSKIEDFESRFDWLQFIDPRRNMKWYADKLIAARKRSRLRYSVV